LRPLGLKKKRVRTSPNSKFADIKTIKKTQNKAIGVPIIIESLDESGKSDISSLSDSTADCIEVLGD
jgi:hypothetical protein